MVPFALQVCFTLVVGVVDIAVGQNPGCRVVVVFCGEATSDFELIFCNSSQ